MLCKCIYATVLGLATSACSQSVLKTRPAATSKTQVQQSPPEVSRPSVEPLPNELPAGIPLRVELDHTYAIKTGTRVEGHLIAPVFRIDHEVLPVNTRVSGVIVSIQPVKSSVRRQALMDGDFTPLAVPDVQFDTLTLPDGSHIAIHAQAVERTANVVRMGSKLKQPTLKHEAVDQIKQTKQEALDTIEKPGKADRLKRFLYAQLPYHPQRIWLGTEYDADLTSPLLLPNASTPAPLQMADLGGRTPTGRVEARLADGIDSRLAKKGDVVEAVLTRPLLSPSTKGTSSQKLVLPEGTRLTGTVLQASPAKWFARNGKLRFTFRQIELPEGTANAEVHGRITAAEAASGQNLSIDPEGGTKANPDKGKYLVPLALGVLAAASMDDDGNLAAKGAVTSNGFGVIARVAAVAAASPNVSAAFAYFALSKSVYRRWIAKGTEVSFPKDTRLEIDLAAR